QLLNHTSGIESYTENEEWIVRVYKDPTHFWNAPSELLKLVRGAHSPPGSPFYYSNTNFILLGMIAAKADGYSFNDWDKVIQRRFLDKLALTNSHIPVPRDVELGSTNRGYVNFYNFLGVGQDGRPNCFIVNPSCQNADSDFTRQDMSNAWSAGEIISTVGDLTKWINAEVKGDLLPPAIRQQQQQFIPTCVPGQKDCHTADVEVGLAMFKQMRFGFIGHRGEIFGFNGTIQYLPQRDLTVVVLSNRTALDGNHVGPIPETVAAALFPGLESRPTPRAPGNSQLSLPDRLSHFPLPARFRKRSMTP
ncbi:MAG: serine hydrolase domain-containing protein, partial [Cystobacter sp.]